MSRPRVFLLTYPSLFGAATIAAFGQEKRIDVVGVGLSDRIFKGKGCVQSSLRFTGKTGPQYAAFTLLITNAAWKYLKAFSPLTRLLPAMNARTVVLGADREIARVRALRPDYIVSCYFNQIIPMPLARIARIGCINSHASLLPAHRGPDPVFWAIENGDQSCGVSVHVVEEHIDTGPLLEQRVIDVQPARSVFGAARRLWQAAAACAVEFVAQGRSCHAAARQAEYLASHEPWPTSADVRRLRSRGIPLLDLEDYSRALRETARELAKCAAVAG